MTLPLTYQESRMSTWWLLGRRFTIGVVHGPNCSRSLMVRVGWIPVLLLLVSTAFGAGRSAEKELTIVYTGSTNGAIWPCYGCSLEPLGGLARRAMVLWQLRQERPDLLLLDSGDLLSARGRANGDRKVLEVYRLLGYDAVNIGDQEFTNGRDFFDAEVLSANLPLVSASLWYEQTNELLLPPYVVRMVSGVRVGIIGLVDAQAFMVLRPGAYQGVRVASIMEILERYLPKVRAQADVLIVLSHLGIEGDRDLAEEVPGLHLIVGGHSGASSRQPLEVGGTLIVQPGSGGQYVGRLDLTLNKAFQIKEYEHTAIPLDAAVPDDPAVVEVVRQVAVWEAGSQKEVMPALHTGRLFTESERCGGCHRRVFEIWKQHGHAQAFDILSPEWRGNLGCLPCHATGWAKGG